MARDTSPSAAATHIDIDREEDVQHWAVQLGLTAQELRLAVVAVGNRVSAVQAYQSTRQPPRAFS